MRTARVCSTCAKYENALCVLYNGSYLSALDISPLDNLEDILIKINNALGTLLPTTTSTTTIYLTTTTSTSISN